MLHPNGHDCRHVVDVVCHSADMFVAQQTFALNWQCNVLQAAMFISKYNIIYTVAFEYTCEVLTITLDLYIYIYVYILIHTLY